MKQATGCFGLKAIGYGLINGSVSIYAQAIWRMSSRSIAGRLRPGKKGRWKSQARYERIASHAPTKNVNKSQAADKPGAVMTETLPAGTLTEIRSISLSEHYRTGVPPHNLRQSLQQILPALASFCQQRWLVLVAPPCLPSIDELKKAGINPARVLLVHSNVANSFNVLEQTLRSGTCGAVLAWLEKGDAQTLNCLRQAAEAGNAWGVLFCGTKQARNSRLSSFRKNENIQLKIALR